LSHLPFPFFYFSLFVFSSDLVWLILLSSSTCFLFGYMFDFNADYFLVLFHIPILSSAMLYSFKWTPHYMYEYLRWSIYTFKNPFPYKGQVHKKFLS
jgi:hypothetical protein